MKRALLFLLLLAICPHPLLLAQGEVGLRFLLFPPSPEGNGMGSITGPAITDNPLAALANPGQLGAWSIDHYLTGALYPSATAWLPGFDNSDFTYSVKAVNAGINLNRLFVLPFRLGVGFGYSHIKYDGGTFLITRDDPTVLGSFQAEEHADNYSVALGIEYYLRLGFGYTTKSVQSNLVPFTVQGQARRGIASLSTYDLGMFAQAPVVGIVNQLTGTSFLFAGSLKPLLDLSLGYARSNLGDHRIGYIDVAQADPLPRNAMLGLSIKAGVLVTPDESPSLELVSATLAREADDILVRTFPAPVDSQGYVTGAAPPPVYRDGSGAIQFMKNIILGEQGERVTIHKGWQLSFSECFSLRGGSAAGRGFSYTTSGYGLRLGGIVKLLTWVSPTLRSFPVMRFMASHVDLSYDHASSRYDDPYNPNDGVTYNGLSLVLK